MWRDLTPVERAIREKARQAAREAVATVWRTELDRLLQDFPDHDRRPVITYP
jgi:hypothetical protein